ncbi:galactose-binding domain-like protein [Phlyctochytrium arcticum]|nr:galactose-binding domain-like protein [Phlyctochytrium arcticum]
MPAAQENMAAAGSGAKVTMATSEHPAHPAENVLDGSSRTFWVSTGLFPQELMVTMPALITVRKIVITCMKVGRISVECCSTDKAQHFDGKVTQDLEESEQTIQTCTITPAVETQTAKHIRVAVTKGFSPFIGIQKVIVYGDSGSSVMTVE